MLHDRPNKSLKLTIARKVVGITHAINVLDNRIEMLHLLASGALR